MSGWLGIARVISGALRRAMRASMYASSKRASDAATVAASSAAWAFPGWAADAASTELVQSGQLWSCHYPIAW